MNRAENIPPDFEETKMIVAQVDAGSIAYECEIEAGDVLLSINGHALRDYIDYIYELAEEDILLVVQKKDGTIDEIDIEKEPYEGLGVAFENDGFGRSITCRNKCVFCFVDQLPLGLRKTLYVKDDDWRMSFLMGSYVTLTNLSEAEAERIIEQQISPLYISVHACDDVLRNKLFGNKNAAKAFEYIKRFAKSGIRMHTQIVMCEGLNDGAVLENTVKRLYELYPEVQSVAVVPAGLTKHREHLPELAPVSKKTANETVCTTKRLQKEFLKDNGQTRFVFASDEMYIRADEKLPSYEEYEDFVQIENGVGLVEMFLFDAREALEDIVGGTVRYSKIGFITGADFYPYLKELAQKIEAALNISINVYCVKNDFFGETITVTGLLTGADIVRQVKPNGEEAMFLSRCCFKENEEIMLDNLSIDEIGKALRVPCYKVDGGGYELIQMLLQE
ncbi:MAG: DUF512 domain-containing protein [Christensenella sp.]